MIHSTFVSHQRGWGQNPDAMIHYRGAADTRVRKLDNLEMQRLPDGGEVGYSSSVERRSAACVTQPTEISLPVAS